MSRKTKFKYNINHQISLLPRGIDIVDIEEILKRDYAISRDTFFRDRSITAESASSIPTDRLEIYSTLFGCTTDALKNYEPKKGKSIIQIMNERAKRVVKTGLRVIAAIFLFS